MFRAPPNAVFEYMDAKGGIDGRTINFVIKDDCYNVTGAFSCTSSYGTVAQTQALDRHPGLCDRRFARYGYAGPRSSTS
jgi:hypothetical protein